MRKAIVTPIVAGLIGFAALAAPVAAQASTSPTGDTTTTFTLDGPDGAALFISVQSSIDLSAGGAGHVTDHTVEGSLGQVQVTDDRADYLIGWSTEVTSSSFQNQTYAAVSIPATSVDYAPGTFDKTGTLTVSGNSGTIGGRGDSPLVAAATSDAVGVNTATWSPDLTVNLPGDAVAGVYQGTITHSVA